MKNEIILYRSNELAEHIEVRIDEEKETVWLTQSQIAELFQRDRTVITKHVRNIFATEELDEKSNMQKMHIPNSDKPVVFYTLDVILSVGYRVNSKQGTQFRQWATQRLKDYLLKGYAINNRMNRIENTVENLAQKVNLIDLQINTHLIPTQGVFFDGQVFDAYVLVSKIISNAKKSIVLIDNYVDESVLVHLTKKHKNATVTILTKTINKQLQLDVQKANAQYPSITIKQFSQSHDRFLIIDETEVYHLGASLKDLGKKWFAFSKMDKSSVQNILNSILELI